MIGLKILLGLILTTTVTNVSATHLMSQCVKATSKIKTLGCIMRLTIDFGGGGGPMKAVKRDENYRIFYSKPSKIAVVCTGCSVTGGNATGREDAAYPQYPRAIISNGSWTYVLDSSTNRYLLQREDITGALFKEYGSGAFDDYEFGSLVFDKRNIEGAGLIQDSRKYGKVLKQQVIDHVLCDVLSTSLPSGPMTYWIGHKDHLLRQVKTDMSGGMVITERYQISIENGRLPADAFRISPPPGAVKVDMLN